MKVLNRTKLERNISNKIKMSKTRDLQGTEFGESLLLNTNIRCKEDDSYSVLLWPNSVFILYGDINHSRHYISLISLLTLMLYPR